MQRGQSQATILAFRPRATPTTPGTPRDASGDASKAGGSRGAQGEPQSGEVCGRMAAADLASDIGRPIARPCPHMGEIVLFTGVRYSRASEGPSCDEVSPA